MRNEGSEGKIGRVSILRRVVIDSIWLCDGLPGKQTKVGRLGLCNMSYAVSERLVPWLHQTDGTYAQRRSIRLIKFFCLMYDSSIVRSDDLPRRPVSQSRGRPSRYSQLKWCGRTREAHRKQKTARRQSQSDWKKPYQISACLPPCLPVCRLCFTLSNRSIRRYSNDMISIRCKSFAKIQLLKF